MHSEETTNWVNAGALAEKPHLGAGLRMTHMNLKHLVLALRREVATGRTRKPRAVGYAVEVMMTANGVVAWREILLLFGEMVGMAKPMYVARAFSKFQEWVAHVVHLCGGSIVDANFEMRNAEMRTRSMLMDALIDLIEAPRNTVCDTMARYVAYTSTGCLDPLDENLPTPTVNGDQRWAGMYAGIPESVRKARIALVTAILGGDFERATRNAFLMCVWSYPDVVWDTLRCYFELQRLPEYRHVAQDLEWSWALFSVTDTRRSEVPRQEYWGRGRVFMVMCIFIACHNPQLTPEDDVIDRERLEWEEDPLKRLFNSYAMQESVVPEPEHLPPFGRYPDAQIQCAAAGRAPSAAADVLLRGLLGQVPGDDPLRARLAKCVAIAYCRNYTQFGVRGCIEWLRDALEHGRDGHGLNHSGAPGGRRTRVPAQVQEDLVRRDNNIVDRVPGVKRSSVIVSGEAQSLFGDSVPEFRATVEIGFPHRKLANNHDWVMFKGPYEKPGRYAGLRNMNALRSLLGLDVTWLVDTLRVGNSTVLAMQPIWNPMNPPPRRENLVTLMEHNCVDELARVLVERYFADLCPRGEYYVYSGDRIFSLDDLWTPARREEHKMPFDDEPMVFAYHWIEQNIGAIRRFARGTAVLPDHDSAHRTFPQMKMRRKLLAGSWPDDKVVPLFAKFALDPPKASDTAEKK